MRKDTPSLAAALLLVAVASLVTETCARERPLDVLLICIDDLRPELGCEGVAHAQTPCIDALAASGMRFSQHFVAVPTCGASRYAMLTGRDPARSGVRGGNHALHRGKAALRREETPGAQSLPELFRRSGYRTVGIGKISHTADGLVYGYDGQGDGQLEMPHAWTELTTPYGPWKRGWGTFFAYAGGAHREDGTGRREVSEHVVATDDELPDGMMATAACAKLAELAREAEGGRAPFFLAVGFYKPHLPFVSPRGDLEAFADVEIPLPEHPERPQSPYWHKSGEMFRYGFPFEVERPLSPEQVIALRRSYLACVRYVDRQIGRVLAALEAQGLAETTVVVLWSDHGWNLGDSELWGKHTLFERALRSPLIIRVPGMETAGRECRVPVSSIDLFPTLVDVCAPAFGETHHPLDGVSLRPLLEGGEGLDRPGVRSYWQRSVSLRTSTHRLIATRRDGAWGSVELYDAGTSFDPVRNLAEERSETVEALLPHLGD